MEVTRAIITAAGRGARQYPAADTVQKAMLPLVDRDGLTKPVLQIIAEEAIESGIEEICVVCARVTRRSTGSSSATMPRCCTRPGRPTRPKNRLANSSTSSSGCGSRFSRSPMAMGTPSGAPGRSSAIKPCLLLLSDHVYVSAETRRCARQLIDLATAEGCAVSAVQATREHLIHQYGTVSGRRLPDKPEVYLIDEIIEKPNPTLAELRLQVPGLRAGHYLCFFGMHVLTPGVFDLLDDLINREVRELGSIQLTTALNALARRERYLALETRGSRFNLGVKFGMVEAQIALALAGADRDRILSLLLESVVRVEQGSPR